MVQKNLVLMFSEIKSKTLTSTVSLEGGRKYVILDGDRLSKSSIYSTCIMRGFMEEFHKNCGFILTCNYKNRLIESLHSRCSVIDFIIPKGDKLKLIKDFFGRVKNILEQENIKYESRVVMEVLTKYFPDWLSRTLNELQRYSTSGQIDVGILVNISEVNINELVAALKAQEFTNVRKWIVHNLDNDLSVCIAVFMTVFMSLLILALYLMQFLSYLSTSISQHFGRPRNKFTGLSNRNYGGCEMEIDNVQVVKFTFNFNFNCTIMKVYIKPLNEIVDVVKDRKDMGSRLVGVIETESEIPHSMLEEKK